MRLQRQTGRRIAVITLCLSLAAAGCDGGVDLGDLTDGGAGLPIGFTRAFARTLPVDTCVSLVISTFNYDPTWTLDFCEGEGEGSGYGTPQRTDRILRKVAGSGAFVIDSVVIAGTVSGSNLPRWTAVLSSAPGGGGAGTSTALASVASADGDGDPTGAVPVKILATLYDVSSKGKRKKAGKKQARFDKKTGGASVLFDNLSGARDHYEIDVTVKGGKVTAGTVSYAASTSTQSSRRIGAVSGRWLQDDSSRAGATPLTTWAGVGVTSVGKTPSGKVPEATIVAYPEQAGRVAGRSAAFDVIGLAMQGDAELNPPTKQLKKVQFTLYAVDAKGKRSKLATKTGKVAKKNGVALVVMEGVAAAASHYEIDIKALGGKMQDSNLSASAIVAPAGAAGRLLMSSRLAGFTSLPPLVDHPERAPR